MIELLAVAVVFIVTEIFKKIITELQKRTGKKMTKEEKGNTILLFGFGISLIYSFIFTSGYVTPEMIAESTQIFAYAIATYEVLYKRILCKVINNINS